MTDHTNRLQLPPGKQVDLLPAIRAHVPSPDTPQANRLQERVKDSRKFIVFLAPTWENKSLEEIADWVNHAMDMRDQQASENI